MINKLLICFLWTSNYVYIQCGSKLEPQLGFLDNDTSNVMKIKKKIIIKYAQKFYMKYEENINLTSHSQLRPLVGIHDS